MAAILASIIIGLIVLAIVTILVFDLTFGDIEFAVSLGIIAGAFSCFISYALFIDYEVSNQEYVEVDQILRDKPEIDWLVKECMSDGKITSSEFSKIKDLCRHQDEEDDKVIEVKSNLLKRQLNVENINEND
jgi:hypothetical protein